PPAGRHLVVAGAPGTGKTTVALAAFGSRIRGEAGLGETRHVLLAPTRRAAARLRDEVSVRVLGTADARRGLHVGTPAAFAYTIVRAFAVARGRPAPTLITGAQQDRFIADLLAGHAEGIGARLPWPEAVPSEALRIAAFRAEVRDLFMRSAEFGLTAEELAERGHAVGRPEWVAVAGLLEEYRDVVALADLPAERGERYDSAAIVSEAATILADWESFTAAPAPEFDSVVVDDAQEATPATARLLHALADRGTHLTLLADPDVAVQTFRGARPQLVSRAAAVEGLGAFDAELVVLPQVHRGGPALRDLVRDIADRVPVAGLAAHRLAQVPPEAAVEPRVPAVRAVQVPSDSAQVGHAARSLREEHLYAGMPWDRMAVVVRSSRTREAFAAALRAQLVPVARASRPVVLREEPAVRALLAAVEAGIRGLTPAGAQELLSGPIGGFDPLALRRARRELRRRIRAGEFGDGATIDDALVEVLDTEAGAGVLPHDLRRGVVRVTRVLDSVRAAAGERAATHETVLWAAWEATGFEAVWQRRAIGGGPAGLRADDDLDAVMALFAAAANHAERVPLAHPMEFVDLVLGEDLPTDSLAATGQGPGGVEVLTVAEAAGREWDVVVVPGLQEGAWPDTRIRDSLLGAERLAELELGRMGFRTDAVRDHVAARHAVLGDEWRMLTSALSRARRTVVVTAVRDLEQRPSAFFDQVAEHVSVRGGQVERPGPFTRLDLRGLVARLRAGLDGGEPAEELGALLAVLARAGAAGADPAEWAGLADPTTVAPLKAPGAPVHVSPSRVELAGTCPLRWALETSGGRCAERIEQNLGSLIHEIAAAHPHGTAEELIAALESSFDSLGLPEGWIRSRERRRAERMLRLFADYASGVPGEVATEVEVEQRVGDAVVHGYVDRLETVDGGVRIVDLKTGHEVSVAEAERHAQLGVYQLAVSEEAPAGQAAAGARLVHLRPDRHSPGVREQAPLPEDGGWAREALGAAVAVMRGGTVTAAVNATCRYCPVRTSCPVTSERCAR
ncbi:MAG: PD-(D/E)XK nuclease family protein, partial [Actinomycetota bacterium]